MRKRLGAASSLGALASLSNAACAKFEPFIIVLRVVRVGHPTRSDHGHLARNVH
jgi:hypothetical protein